MNKYNRYVFLILAPLLFFGCAAPGPMFEPMIKKEDMATLYIYRPKKFSGGGTYPHIYVNGKEKAPLRNGGYIASYLEPGEYTIESKGKDWKWDLPDSSVSVSVAEGNTYYIKLDYESDIGIFNSGKQKSQSAWPGSLWIVNYGAGFHPVNPTLGGEEIRSLKLSY